MFGKHWNSDSYLTFNPHAPLVLETQLKTKPNIGLSPNNYTVFPNFMITDRYLTCDMFGTSPACRDVVCFGSQCPQLL